MITPTLQTADLCQSHLSNCAEGNSEALDSKKFQSLNVNSLKDNRDAKMVEKDNKTVKNNLCLHACPLVTPNMLRPSMLLLSRDNYYQLTKYTYQHPSKHLEDTLMRLPMHY
jgi:hypothetical protein